MHNPFHGMPRHEIERIIDTGRTYYLSHHSLQGMLTQFPRVGEAKALLEEARAYLATLQAPEAQRASLTADGTVADTGEVKAPGSLPDMAVVRDMDGKLFIVTYGRFDRVGGQPFTPGERPEMSHEVQVSFDLSEARRNPDMRAGPLFYTGLRYEGDWENVAKYQPAQVQEAAAVPEPDFPGITHREVIVKAMGGGE